jgi:formylglycine-generating enzyme
MSMSCCKLPLPPASGLAFGVIAAMAMLASPSAFAVPRLNLTEGMAGSRTLVLSIDEPVNLADLRSIQVEGYDVEQVTWIEEDSLVLSPLVIDLTAKGAPRIREVIPNQKVLQLEAPLFFVPKSGQILADTAFGGVLCRILSASSDGPTLGITRRWLVTYEPAAMEDVFISADLRFRSTFDMTVIAGDSMETGNMLGLMSDSTLASAQFTFGWTNARIKLRPELSGRIKVTRSRIEAFDLGLHGLAEAAGRFRLDLKGKGRFAWERILQAQTAVTIPLGHGVQLRAAHTPTLAVQAVAEDSVLMGESGFRLQQNLRSGPSALPGGQPFGDAKLGYEIFPSDSSRGSGKIHFQVKSQLEVKFGASDFHRISLVHEATLMQEVHSGLEGPQGALPWRQRQIKLGGSLSLDQRLDSAIGVAGVKGARGWLLYNRELPLLAPPKMMAAQVLKGDAYRGEGQKFFLACQAQPKADWYTVQGLMPAATLAAGGHLGAGGNLASGGVWVNLIEKASMPRIRLPDFSLPGMIAPLRIRVVAGNAYGQSQPYPLEGLVLPKPNRPPYSPIALLPENDVVADTTLRLSWKASDPDSGTTLTYRLLLDTRNPPLNVVATHLADSAYLASDLAPATAYYWRVRVSDGTDSSESAVKSFKTRAAEPEPITVPMNASAGNPWVFLPKGSFVREDGVKVTVGPLYMQKYEVNQGDYRDIMGENPSFRTHDSLPVERVTWDEAQAYCKNLGGRLPTEAEWEYASRGGKPGLAWEKGKAADYAWYRANAEGRTRKVGRLKPNGYGLHDMAGNVFEWVEDWYGPYDAKASEHPQGPVEGTARVIRGASWYSEAASLTPGNRFFNRPGFRNYKVGFRCVEEGPSTPTTAGISPEQ